jgi:hypothetical protein
MWVSVWCQDDMSAATFSRTCCGPGRGQRGMAGSRVCRKPRPHLLPAADAPKHIAEDALLFLAHIRLGLGRNEHVAVHGRLHELGGDRVGVEEVHRQKAQAEVIELQPRDGTVVGAERQVPNLRGQQGC